MVNTVTLNGNTYTDDSDATTGLGNGGHRTRFIPALSDFLTEADAHVTAAELAETNAETAETNAETAATNAAASAASAVSAPGTNATSTTSLTIGTGSKALTIQTGKSIVVGMSVKVAYTTDPTKWMYGDVTAYNSGTGSLTVNVTKIASTGTFAAWTISLSGGASPSTDWAEVINKPTTLGGYGITDGADLSLAFYSMGA